MADCAISDASSSLSSSDVDQHLEMGLRLLSQGQLQDALTHFHAAIGQSLKHAPDILSHLCIIVYA